MFKKITNIGIEKGLNTYERKIRTFFNQISLIGAIFILSQAILFGALFSLEIGLILFIGSIGSIFGLVLHYKVNFLVARLVSFLSIFIAGFITSALIGKEHAFHLGSLTVIVVCVICFSKKEFLYSISLLVLAFLGIFIVESNYFKIEVSSLPDADTFRVWTIIITLLFVLYELYFISHLSESSEEIADSRLKKSSQTVKIQNEEIQLMMREIHHRVKNNLQIIISLLRLRSHDLNDEKAKELFDTTIDRIQSMSILHQKIYQSQNISKFDAEDYIETLTSNLIQSYSIDSEIDLKVKSNILEINNDFIVSFALILNELISNSLKHAFGEEMKGRIDIEFIKKEGHFSLLYKDTGSWKPFASEDSFGLELIRLLTEQIQGTYERKTGDSGTEYRFKF